MITEIRMAELYVGSGTDVVVTHGVGSCLAIVLYDHVARVGGMAHAILPHATMDATAIARADNSGKYFVKYVDLAIDTLIVGILASGGVRERLVAKLVGGAHMFTLLEGDAFSIGRENTESARERLLYQGIPVETEVVGGAVGRNVRFDCATGIVEITTKV
jgi:chemotaxis protein CheD